MTEETTTTTPTATHSRLLAGYVSGMAGLLVGHPLDSLKVWLQNSCFPSQILQQQQSSLQSNMSSTPYNKAAVAVPRTNHSSFVLLSTTRKMVQASPLHVQRRYFLVAADAIISSTRGREGLSGSVIPSRATIDASKNSASAGTMRQMKALYSGIATPLVTVGAIQAINYTLYDSFRFHLHDREYNRNNDTLTNVCISAFASGGIVSILTGPLLTLKIRQQVTGWNLRNTLSQSHSLSGWYRGYSLHFTYEALGRAVFFTAYEGLKRSFAEQDKVTTTLTQRWMAASVAGMLSCSVMYPLDAVRSRVCAQSILEPQQRAMASSLSSVTNKKVGGIVRDVAQKMYIGGGGWRAFFRGYKVTVLRSGIVASVALPIYDLTLDWLDPQC